MGRETKREGEKMKKYEVSYNGGYCKMFNSKREAAAFARSIRGGGCKPVVREVES
jgi:hypothetical protein